MLLCRVLKLCHQKKAKVFVVLVRHNNGGKFPEDSKKRGRRKQPGSHLLWIPIKISVTLEQVVLGAVKLSQIAIRDTKEAYRP